MENHKKLFYCSLALPLAFASFALYSKLTKTKDTEPTSTSDSLIQTLSSKSSDDHDSLEETEENEDLKIATMKKIYKSEKLNGSPQLVQELIEKKYLEYIQHPEHFLIEKIMEENSGNQMEQLFGGKLNKMLIQIGAKYNNVAYHNLTHAFDVTTCLYDILSKGLRETLGLDSQQFAVSLIAAYAHDINHQGFSGPYYQNSNHQWSINYGFDSPLQKMHIRTVMSIIESHKEIKLSKQHKKIITEMILSTDNTYHHKNLSALKQIVGELNDAQPQKKPAILHKNRIMILGQSLHFADLNNCSKDFHLFVEWSTRLFQQFEIQAAVERKQNLAITYTTNISVVEKNCAQYSFIKGMVMPLYYELKNIDERSFASYKKNLQRNLETYRTQRGKVRRQSI